MSSDVTDETAIITIEVDLVSKVTGDPVGEIDESHKGSFLGDVTTDEIMDEAIDNAINDAMEDAIDEAMEKAGIDTKQLSELTKNIQEWDAKTVGNITSMGKNPESFMENTLLSTLARAGPQGALAVAIISSIAGTPEMVKAVIHALGDSKGSPLNLDYAFSQEEQANLHFDRHVQFRRLTGDNPVITVLTKGFIVGDKDFLDNSLVDADLARSARVGLRESSLGLITGI